jgi:Tfp pilus assembly protein PilN
MAAAATATARRSAATRRAPLRKPAPRRAPTRRPGGQLIPLAVGTATAVGRLPDSSLVVRMTRGRAWIAVLGVLLVGIVALNVITLSLAATAGRVDQNIQALDQENSILRSRDAQRSGAGRIRHDAASLGLSAASIDEVTYVKSRPNDIATAAQRLAAAETSTGP